MGFCDACQSAGSVNRYGFCEICGTVHEAVEPIQLRTAEVIGLPNRMEVTDSLEAYEVAGAGREAAG